jgi:hypothetical protein
MRPISCIASDSAVLARRRAELPQDQRRGDHAIAECLDDALHIVPVGLDQLPVEALDHERRQHGP